MRDVHVGKLFPKTGAQHTEHPIKNENLGAPAGSSPPLCESVEVRSSCQHRSPMPRVDPRGELRMLAEILARKDAPKRRPEYLRGQKFMVRNVRSATPSAALAMRTY